MVNKDAHDVFIHWKLQLE